MLCFSLILIRFVGQGQPNLNERQSVPNIRIVRVGEETKPVGTLLISVKKQIRPVDRDIDSIFGKGIATDQRTFDRITIFITKNKILVSPPASYGIPHKYKFILPDSSIRYVNTKDSQRFFGDFQTFLKSEHLDPEVVKAIDHYY
jgi:hypothetical protein